MAWLERKARLVKLPPKLEELLLLLMLELGSRSCNYDIKRGRGMMDSFLRKQYFSNVSSSDAEADFGWCSNAVGCTTTFFHFRALISCFFAGADLASAHLHSCP